MAFYFFILFLINKFNSSVFKFRKQRCNHAKKKKLNDQNNNNKKKTLNESTIKSAMMNSVCTLFYPQHLELEQLESSLMMFIFYLLYIKQDNYQKNSNHSDSFGLNFLPKDFYFIFPSQKVTYIKSTGCASMSPIK